MRAKQFNRGNPVIVLISRWPQPLRGLAMAVSLERALMSTDPEHVPKKLTDFFIIKTSDISDISDENMLQPINLEHLLFARPSEAERKIL